MFKEEFMSVFKRYTQTRIALLIFYPIMLAVLTGVVIALVIAGDLITALSFALSATILIVLWRVHLLRLRDQFVAGLYSVIYRRICNGLEGIDL